MTNYRITPNADGKWYIEKYACYSYTRSFFGKCEDIWSWFRTSEGFESAEEAKQRLEFTKQPSIYITMPDQPSNKSDGSNG